MDNGSVLTAIDDTIATITLNRPTALNSLTAEMVDQLRDAFDSVADRPAVRCVILTGAGRGFCTAAAMGLSEAQIEHRIAAVATSARASITAMPTRRPSASTQKSTLVRGVVRISLLAM